MALFSGLIEIERAVFVFSAQFPQMKRRHLGKAKLEETFFVHTATLQHTGRFLKHT